MGKIFDYRVGCHTKLVIFSEPIGNHFQLLSVALKPLEHYFQGILEFEAQCIWNSDHVVLKSSICTSALPRWQRSHWGLGVTQHSYFSLLTHTKQLLLVTFCEKTAGNGSVMGRTGGMPQGQTDVKVEIVMQMYYHKQIHKSLFEQQCLILRRADREIFQVYYFLSRLGHKNWKFLPLLSTLRSPWSSMLELLCLKNFRVKICEIL